MLHITLAEENASIVRKLWETLSTESSLTPAFQKAIMNAMDTNIGWEVVPLGIKRRGIAEMEALLQGIYQTALKMDTYIITNFLQATNGFASSTLQLEPLPTNSDAKSEP